MFFLVQKKRAGAGDTNPRKCPALHSWVICSAPARSRGRVIRGRTGIQVMEKPRPSQGPRLLKSQTLDTLTNSGASQSEGGRVRLLRKLCPHYPLGSWPTNTRRRDVNALLN